MGIARSDAHHRARRIVFDRFLVDIGLRILLIHVHFKHPLGLRIDHAFRRKPRVLIGEVRIFGVIQRLEQMKVPFFDGYENLVGVSQFSQGLDPGGLGECHFKHGLHLHWFGVVE